LDEIIDDFDVAVDNFNSMSCEKDAKAPLF